MTPFSTTVYKSSSFKISDELSYLTWHLLSVLVRKLIGALGFTIAIRKALFRYRPSIDISLRWSEGESVSAFLFIRIGVKHGCHRRWRTAACLL